MGNIFAPCVSVLPHAVPRVHGSKGIDTAGGTTTASSTAQQPLVLPSDWFLTSDEITKSRGGVVRSDLSLYSTGDHVTPYASSDAYFRQLLADLEAADVTGVWISGWSLNHTVPLDPTRPNRTETTLQVVLERAVAQRGVHVRALVWANLFMRTECLATRDWMNALGASSANGSALMLFDNRLPHHVSSHHQKCVVLQRANGSFIAFLGGLDITVDRWDTQAHDQAALRVQSGWTAESDGWIDASVRLEGSAARDVAATFAARWNSTAKPANCWKQELLDFDNPREYQPVPTPPPPPSTTAPTKTETHSTLSVQIVRTYSPVRATKKYPGVAPSGELSLLESRLRAIANARNWIYIEDQYFFFMPQLMTALRTALTSQQALRVVVFVQNPSITTQSKLVGYEKLVFEMAKPLLDAFAMRFQIYTIKPTRNLYIHTKLLIVDDTFVSISSANWNRRSMTSDSELGANLVDAALVTTPDGVRVGSAVRELQLQKLQEFTGRSTDVWRGLTIAQRCDALEQAAREATSILQRLEVEEKWEFVVFHDEFTLHVVDPDDVNHRDHAGDSSDDEQ